MIMSLYMLCYAISKLVVVWVLCLEHRVDCIRGMKKAEAKLDTVTAAACTTRERHRAGGVFKVPVLAGLAGTC